MNALFGFVFFILIIAAAIYILKLIINTLSQSKTPINPKAPKGINLGKFLCEKNKWYKEEIELNEVFKLWVDDKKKEIRLYSKNPKVREPICFIKDRYLRKQLEKYHLQAELIKIKGKELTFRIKTK